MLIEDLLSRNPLSLVTATPDTYIREAAQRMARCGIGVLVVVHNAEEVAGVLSERDIIAALGRSNTIIDFARVGDLMTSIVVTISPKDTLINAVKAMGTHGIRHLVVTDNDRPIGVLSIRDILRVIGTDPTGVNTEFSNKLKDEIISALAA